MMARRTFWGSTLAGLVVVASLAAVGHWARGHPAGGCALDGSPIDPVYRVAIVDARGNSHEFCCLTCARMWLDRQSTPPRAVTVTDETSGERIDAAAAYYVRSAVVTRAATGNRIHVFRNRADAEKHADACAGYVLSEAEGPFRPWLRPARGDE
jgi:hypothetical protein